MTVEPNQPKERCEMNTINIPGFTAEDSLYKSRTQYNMSATRFLAAKADLRPQRRRGMRSARE